MELVLVVTVLLILLFLTVPVAMSLFFAGLFAFSLFGDVPLKVLGQIMVIKLDSYPLLAVLFFILAGNIMVSGKISQYLINFAGSVVGSIRGGLAISGVVACALFGAISGSALATYAAIGGIMVPALREKGYGEKFSVGTMAANSVLGIIIPPSIPMVIYCIIADQSVGRLFLAGFLPGIFLVLAVSVWIHYWARKNRIGGLAERMEFRNIAFHFKRGFWALLLPLVIFGGIFGGAFTATEAAVVASVYCLVVELYVYKFLKLSRLKGIIVESGVTTATLLILVAGASAFGEFVTLKQVPEMVIRFFSAFVSSPFSILLMVIAVLLVVGCFIDTISALLIFAPIVVPLCAKYQIDLIHLGLVATVALGIGYVTPPFGANLYLAVGMHKVKFSQVVAGAMPSIVIWIAVLVILALFPQISTSLPDFFIGVAGK